MKAHAGEVVIWTNGGMYSDNRTYFVGVSNRGKEIARALEATRAAYNRDESWWYDCSVTAIKDGSVLGVVTQSEWNTTLCNIGDLIDAAIFCMCGNDTELLLLEMELRTIWLPLKDIFKDVWSDADFRDAWEP